MFPSGEAPICYLFDNGSLRAESTRSLRALAVALEARLKAPVRAVSLLHSSNVPAAQLDGTPARLLEPALREHLATHPHRPAVALPLFFGPSGALTDYLPARLAALRTAFPKARLAQARWLVDPPDDDAPEIVRILVRRVQRLVLEQRIRVPKVVLVDHGTPQRAVTAVRDHLGEKLAEALGSTVSTVAVASMERRAGPEFNFNEPVLERCLGTPPFHQGDVVVLLQFLSPGRHAGPGGDIARICRAAEIEAANKGADLRTFMTEPIANDPELLDVLTRRFTAAMAELNVR